MGDRGWSADLATSLISKSCRMRRVVGFNELQVVDFNELGRLQMPKQWTKQGGRSAIAPVWSINWHVQPHLVEINGLQLMEISEMPNVPTR